MINLRREECMEWLEDYNECLHREKEVRCLRWVGRCPAACLGCSPSAICASLPPQRTRRQVVERERQRQLSGGSKAAGGHH